MAFLKAYSLTADSGETNGFPPRPESSLREREHKQPATFQGSIEIGTSRGRVGVAQELAFVLRRGIWRNVAPFALSL